MGTVVDLLSPHRLTRVVLAAAGAGDLARDAVARLAESDGGGVPVIVVRADDVRGGEDGLVERLVDTIRDGRGTLVVTPHDAGHPGHEAVARAASTAAARTGAVLLEHLSRAGGADDSVTAHSGDHFVVRPAADDALDRLHHEQPDPWGVDDRWYERRRRDLVLAALPRPSWNRALELGCSTGALTAALAPRCGSVVAVDSSRHAVAAARARLSEHGHVRVEHAVVPDEWPPGPFDLVVVSEVGYFLSPAGLDVLVERLAGSVQRDGAVVAAHWRHEVRGWPLDGPAVHDRLRRDGPLPVVAEYRDRDVEILVLARPDTLPDPAAKWRRG